MSQELEQLGLSPAESVLYLQLLRTGTLPLTALLKKVKLRKPAALAALESLAEKGLVQENKSRSGPSYTVLETKQLLSHLDTRVQHVQSQREKAGRVLEQLKAQLIPASARPKVQVFTTVEGVRFALEDTLSSKDKTLRAFLSMSDLEEFLGTEFLERYSKKRVSGGFALQAVRTFERDKRARRRTRAPKHSISNRDEAREVRYINEDNAFPITTYLYDNKVLAISPKEENMAVVYESKELADMQKRLFNLLWRSLTIREISSGRSRG